MRYGMYPGTPPLPFAPAYDVVGVVDQVGEGVSGFGLGQTVAALTVTGGYARYACVPEEKLVPVPPGLDPAEAVSLVLSYVTAYQMLHRLARVRSKERILVHGAAGGVGTALLQLGSVAGLDLYGTESRAKHEHLTRWGAVPIEKNRPARRSDFTPSLPWPKGGRAGSGRT